MFNEQTAIERHQLSERAKSGARWFYWIAALSLITSIIALTGHQWGFIVSLGITQVIDALANNVALEVGAAAKVMAFMFDLIAVGLFALAGLFASKKYSWVFVAGMIAYALDGLLFLYVRDWLGIAFHAYALFSVFGGYKACLKLKEMERSSESLTFNSAPVSQMDTAR